MPAAADLGADLQGLTKRQAFDFDVTAYGLSVAGLAATLVDLLAASRAAPAIVSADVTATARRLQPAPMFRAAPTTSAPHCSRPAAAESFQCPSIVQDEIHADQTPVDCARTPPMVSMIWAGLGLGPKWW